MMIGRAVVVPLYLVISQFVLDELKVFTGLFDDDDDCVGHRDTIYLITHLASRSHAYRTLVCAGNLD